MSRLASAATRSSILTREESSAISSPCINVICVVVNCMEAGSQVWARQWCLSVGKRLGGAQRKCPSGSAWDLSVGPTPTICRLAFRSIHRTLRGLTLRRKGLAIAHKLACLCAVLQHRRMMNRDARYLHHYAPLSFVYPVLVTNLTTQRWSSLYHTVRGDEWWHDRAR